jgi:RNA-directed DNA polymerase
MGRDEVAFLRRRPTWKYRLVEISKRGGGQRVLMIPDDRLMFHQRKILTLLQNFYRVRLPVHGFVKKRSALTNAKVHENRTFLLNLDLKDYFGSISRNRVVGVLERFGIDPNVANAISLICMHRNQLPQGAPTSPILANMVTFRMDRELMEFSKRHHLKYTRYADDLTFSSFRPPISLFKEGLPKEGRIQEMLLSDELRLIIASNGFNINQEKIWFSAKTSRKEVTGIIVNKFPNVKRSFIRDLRVLLHKAETHGPTEAAKEYKEFSGNVVSLEQVLRGRLEWIAQIRGKSFPAYQKLARRFNKLYPKKPIKLPPSQDEIFEKSVWVIEYHAKESESREALIDIQGTCFFLTGFGLVTADHVISTLPEGTEFVVYNPKRPTEKYRAWASKLRCEYRDLAILCHDIPAHAFLELETASLNPIAQTNIQALGFPKHGPGDTMANTPGYIVRHVTKSGVVQIEVTAQLPPGISGGPILDAAQLKVLAVAVKGGAREDRQVGVAISELRKLVQEGSAPPNASDS